MPKPTKPKHALVIMIVPHGKPPKGKLAAAAKRAPKKRGGK